MGTGIAKQLASEDNHVTVIDNNPKNIENIKNGLDVSSFLGFPSHPTVLEDAGAADTEMIIAVTTSDEVNMVVSQVAHSLFNIPIKIARIRHQNYLQPMWKDLYRHDHLPIDYIISPEREVANAVINRLHVPGAMDSIPMMEGRVNVVEMRCTGDFPLYGRPLSRIREHIEHLKAAVIAIKRDEKVFIPSDSDKLSLGDEVFFVADNDDVPEVMGLFGHMEKEARRVLIIGGGNIGLYIAETLEAEGLGVSVKIIELGRERAEYIAARLSETTVINGNSLDLEILHEAGIESTETVISVTNDDEVNILSALLSKRSGAKQAFTLINKGGSYGPLIASLGIDATVDPREMTVSGILQHTRRGKVRAAHSICRGEAELLEIEAFSNSAISGRSVSDLELPSGITVGVILRDGRIIVPDEYTTIMEKDRLLVLALTHQIKKVDKIFSARLDYY